MTTINLDGKWILHDGYTGKVFDAVVPGLDLNDLITHGVLPDVQQCESDEVYFKMSDFDRSYKKTFNVTKAMLKEEKAILHFDRLDTLTEVYVCGKKIAETKNIHLQYDFDIKPYIAEGENEIEVKFLSLQIDIDAPETPIMDGSAKEYAAEIERVGVVEQEAEREYYTVTEEVSFSIPEKGVEVRLLPAEKYDVDVAVDYNSKVLGKQQSHFAEGDNYRSEIAPCRTFVFLHEIMFLFNANLIKGGDVDNAIVVVEHPVTDEEVARLSALFNKKDIKVSGGYLNNLKLRFENEIARHKLLDILGDLALLGRRIRGKVVATRPGHFANTELVKKILAQ